MKQESTTGAFYNISEGERKYATSHCAWCNCAKSYDPNESDSAFENDCDGDLICDSCADDGCDEIATCKCCGSEEIGEKFVGDEGWTVCDDCSMVEGGYVYKLVRK